MGSNLSTAETHSVSMENPSPSGVIDVSEEVVQRLKLGISKVKKQEAQESKTKSIDVPPLAEPNKPNTIPVQEPIVPPRTYYSNPTPPSPQATQLSPVPRFANEPTITAIEMRRQKEIELRENDQMWRTRIAQLKQNLNKTNAVMEEEYSAAIEDVRKRFMTASPTQQLPPCQNLKAQLIACYRAYPGETLKCAEEVSLFRNCVAAHRIKKLDSEQEAAKGA